MTDDQSPALEAGDEVVTEEAETEAKTEATEADAPEGDQADETEEQAEGEAEEGADDESAESKSKARRERRKAELARLREAEAEAQRKADAARKEVERLQAEAEKLPEPKLENFNDYDKYQAALMAYHSIKAVDERERQRLLQDAESDARRADEARQMRDREAAQHWEAQIEDGRSKYEDFEAIALNPNLPISQEMGRVILQSDVAADVTYHLGKNPRIAEQIAGMEPMDMARAIGRLEANLTAPKPKTVSEAPAPIKPVKSKATAVPDVSKMTNEEYRRYRETGKLS